jgi:hypothetical protein
MRINCEWVEGSGTIYCSNTADHILVYGCIQGHLGEHLFCTHHLFIWEEMAQDGRAWCPNEICSGYTRDWIKTPIGRGTVKWLYKHQRIS